MKILVVDDEEPARQRIIDLLADISEDFTILEADNGLDALTIAEQEAPETVMLDIRMPGMDGLESAFHMTSLSPVPAVIFVTAYDEHAIKAFEANAVDYLLKPVRAERLQKALDKASLVSRSRLERLQQDSGENTGRKRTHLSAISQGKIRLIPVVEIRCFRAEQKYVTVYWDGRQTLIDESLKNLEEEFSDNFIRIHRNALISLGHVIALEKNPEGGHRVSIRGMDEKLLVSRRHMPGIKQRLKAFTGK